MASPTDNNYDSEVEHEYEFDDDSYLSDSYDVDVHRSDLLKKIKCKKERFQGITDGKKYYKPEAPELTQIYNIETHLRLNNNLENYVSFYRDIKYVLHIDQNVISNAKNFDFCLVYFYYPWSWCTRETIGNFLRASYKLKVTLGDRCALAMCDVSQNRSIKVKYMQYNALKYILFKMGKIIFQSSGYLDDNTIKRLVEKEYRILQVEKRRKSKELE